ncbi:pre-toxin TG domain-containing protein [Fictibacillus sp. KU28468]|uniref:pre-toxin TG domain-containing protein n=1 Tax=Fictibacillus sp. KU28468 TaxID=2991053 RepID=UPI00223E1714|nr:pre-toxin TG domain-containing protein [Fictibacillus sp. KU28468]UZJ79712.1 pre-toxin TG domain-containing protein [Fictibacillus sp. KU28468]
MSQINVKPDELEALANDIEKLEDQCDDIQDALKWNYNLLHATYWDIDNTHAGGLYHSLIQKLDHYKTLLNNAQEVVKRTEAQFREADQGWFGKAKEWGMELVGVNDVVRIFAEYDPVTGEKLDGWDRLQAVGWTALTIFPPAKLAGLGGKAIIKGAKVLKMGDKAVETFRGMMKVLDPKIIKNAFNRALAGIKEFPLYPRTISQLTTGHNVIDFYKVKDLGQLFSVANGSAGTTLKKSGKVLRTSSGGLKYRTTHGENGELLSAFAKIEKHHINTGTATNTSSRELARVLGKSTDDAGHAIGKKLGGPGGSNSGNIFPQTPSVNRGDFRQFEKEISQEVFSGKEVFVRVVPKYHSGSTRPYEILYQVRIDGQTIKRIFPNP